MAARARELILVTLEKAFQRLRTVVISSQRCPDAFNQCLIICV